MLAPFAAIAIRFIDKGVPVQFYPTPSGFDRVATSPRGAVRVPLHEAHRPIKQSGIPRFAARLTFPRLKLDAGQRNQIVDGHENHQGQHHGDPGPIRNLGTARPQRFAADGLGGVKRQVPPVEGGNWQ